MTVTVRYFAAAAEAAGVPTETVAADAVPTAGRLRATLIAAHGPELERVLARCALLAAGTRLDDDDAPVAPGVTVDVLPPFAGG